MRWKPVVVQLRAPVVTLEPSEIEQTSGSTAVLCWIGVPKGDCPAGSSHCGYEAVCSQTRG